VISPPAASAVSSAVSVQLAGAPLPTTLLAAARAGVQNATLNSAKNKMSVSLPVIFIMFFLVFFLVKRIMRLIGLPASYFNTRRTLATATNRYKNCYNSLQSREGANAPQEMCDMITTTLVKICHFCHFYRCL
jgi:hypothetical protein